MKSNSVERLLVVSVALLAISCVGCSNAKEHIDSYQAGTQMQNAGIMPRTDYMRSRDLAHQTATTHTISNTDLTWTLTMLTGPGNAISRARGFNTLAAIRPMSAGQRQQIAPVIKPYLTSTDQLDRLGAKRVQQNMRRGM